MGPKKGGKGKKGKKGKKGTAFDATPEEISYILQAEIDSLKLRLQRQMRTSDVARCEEMEIKDRDVKLSATVGDDRQNTNDIICTLTS